MRYDAYGYKLSISQSSISFSNVQGSHRVLRLINHPCVLPVLLICMATVTIVYKHYLRFLTCLAHLYYAFLGSICIHWFNMHSLVQYAFLGCEACRCTYTLNTSRLPSASAIAKSLAKFNTMLLHKI